MTQEQMQRFLDITVALSAERDREALLTFILDTVMDLTSSDGGTLYPDQWFYRLYVCRFNRYHSGISCALETAWYGF